jgi:hypothetical protein
MVQEIEEEVSTPAKK